MYKRVYNEEHREKIDVLVTILLLAFAFSFYFFVDVFLGTYIYMTILAAVSFLAFLLPQKIFAKKKDIKVEYKIWWVFVLFLLVLSVVTNGAFVFAVLGVVALKTIGRYRVGFPKPHAGPYDEGEIAAVGPLANIILALIAAGLHNVSGAVVWNHLMMINIWMSIFAMFPFFRFIPLYWSKKVMMRTLKRNLCYTNGEIVFFGSRSLWVFLFTFIVATSLLLLYVKSIFIVLMLAFSIGLVFYVLLHFYVEPRERGPST